jgi:glutamyl-Q tRNA(Asp) synthetase
LPVAVDAAGVKLSKQTLAQPVDVCDPAAALFAAARFLGQNPPEACRRASPGKGISFGHVDIFWQWAKENWRLDKVPRVAAIRIEENP